MPVRNGSSSICLRKIYKGNRNWVCPSILLSGLFSTRRKMNCSPTARPFAGRRDKKEKWWDVSPLFTIGNMLLEDQPTGGCGFRGYQRSGAGRSAFRCGPHVAFQPGYGGDGRSDQFRSPDSWWGLLVSGYEFQPLYENAYNPPYYKELFENYGFQNYFNQHTYLRRLEGGAVERFGL